MNPSDVILAVPPLCGTMDHAEREFAAACVVRTCQVLDNRWQPVTWEQVQEVLRSDLADGIEPFASLLCNPFFRPNFAELGDGRFGRWTASIAFEFTDIGFDALSKWVRKDKL